MSANPSKRNPTALRVVPAPSPAADAYRVLAAAQERLRDEALRSYVATQNRNDRRVTLAWRGSKRSTPARWFPVASAPKPQWENLMLDAAGALNLEASNCRDPDGSYQPRGLTLFRLSDKLTSAVVRFRKAERKAARG